MEQRELIIAVQGIQECATKVRNNKGMDNKKTNFICRKIQREIIRRLSRKVCLRDTVGARICLEEIYITIY
jgi:hypothetical protein